MAVVTTAVIVIAAVILGWVTIEIACKPCLQRGREAIDQSLDPNYDPDSSPIAPQQPLVDPLIPAASSTTTTVKTVE